LLTLASRATSAIVTRPDSDTGSVLASMFEFELESMGASSLMAVRFGQIRWLNRFRQNLYRFSRPRQEVFLRLPVRPRP